jgi:hypothetical protein
MILLSEGTNHASQKALSAARMWRSRAAGFLGLAHLGGIVVACEADCSAAKPQSRPEDNGVKMRRSRLNQKPPIGNGTAFPIHCALRATINLINQINPIPPVQFCPQKYLPSRYPQISPITPAVSSLTRGVGHRHERWDGMRWTRQRRVRLGWRGKLRLVSNRQARGTNGAASVFIKASAACTVGEAS